MLKGVAVAAFLVASFSGVVLACVEPLEAARAREIALFEAGIKRSKLAAVELAKARELRDRAEALYKAGKYSEAEENRHAALIRIGYRLEEETQPPKGTKPEGPPVIGFVPKAAVPSGSLQPGCGGGARWIAPGS